MSYLNTPRLTFSGKFQADVSTVNNDPTHFNNATFQPSYQNYQTGEAPNGWWNPDGTGNWRLVDCTVQSVTYRDGTVETNPSKDPVIGMLISDSNSRTAAKLVDLDTQQQMVSEIWGLLVRLLDKDGRALFSGDYKVAPFTNIWFNRSVDKSADSAAGATYTSVIQNINFDMAGYAESSRFIKELIDEMHKVSSAELSCQFNVDRYNGDNTTPDFTLGRMVGAIGIAYPEDPKHFVRGRQLGPFPLQSPPLPSCNFGVAVYDTNSSMLMIDMGNALQFQTGGVVLPCGNLEVRIQMKHESETLGTIDYESDGWYLKQAGICAIPVSKEQLSKLKNNPLVIAVKVESQINAFTTTVKPNHGIYMSEQQQYVCADKFVFRLNPNEECTIDFYVTNFGEPKSGVNIELKEMTQEYLSGQSAGPFADGSAPPIGTPKLPDFINATGNIITLSPSDGNGKTTFQFKAIDPGNARGYIDGQIYGLGYQIKGTPFMNPTPGIPTQPNGNQSNFVSLMLFSGGPTPESPVQWSTIQPIMKQYANLYPIMSKGIFDLSNQQDVDNNAQILKLVFSKDPEDPNYMPATRDLSDYKKGLILQYLDQVIAKG